MLLSQGDQLWFLSYNKSNPQWVCGPGSNKGDRHNPLFYGVCLYPFEIHAGFQFKTSLEKDWDSNVMIVCSGIVDSTEQPTVTEGNHKGYGIHMNVSFYMADLPLPQLLTLPSVVAIETVSHT